MSYDGSWLTRGHTSLICIGYVIDVLTGIVWDAHVMCSYCQACENKKKSSSKEQCKQICRVGTRTSSIFIHTLLDENLLAEHILPVYRPSSRGVSKRQPKMRINHYTMFCGLSAQNISCTAGQELSFAIC